MIVTAIDIKQGNKNSNTILKILKAEFSQRDSQTEPQENQSIHQPHMLSNCRSVPDSQLHTTYEAQLHKISSNLSLYTTPKPPILPTFTNNPSSAKIPFPPRKK